MWLLDRLLGKRHREGWPRGVRPMFPIIDAMTAHDPEWRKLYGGRSPGVAVPAFRQRNPGWLELWTGSRRGNEEVAVLKKFRGLDVVTIGAGDAVSVGIHMRKIVDRWEKNVAEGKETVVSEWEIEKFREIGGALVTLGTDADAIMTDDFLDDVTSPE